MKICPNRWNPPPLLLLPAGINLPAVDKRFKNYP
jgi:hypothetical protein